MQWLKHAFAVDPEGPEEPTDAQREIVDRVCREVVRRRMSTPALMFLEMSRPLNYLSSQAMHFFNPILAIVADTQSYTEFAKFLERRGSIDYMCRRIEAIEADHNHERTPNEEDRSRQA